MILSDFSVRRPVSATMLITSLLVLGVFCFMRLGLDLFPHFEIPTVTITTTLAGAGPEEIETSITKPIEEAISTISGIDQLRSTTVEGLSRVLVLFDLERDLEAAAQDVRDKVGTIVAELPEGTEPPVIEKFDVDATPVLFLTITGERTLKEVTEIAKKGVKERLEGLTGVGAIRLIGSREREIAVEVSAARLEAYGLTANDVARALAAQNVEIPAGRMVQGPGETVVRTLGRVQAVADFARIPVANREGTPITIGDLGRVLDGVVEPRSLSRYNGVNAVTLTVRKQSGANAVAVVDTIRERLPAIEAALPRGVRLHITRDWSSFIRHAVVELEQHIVVGGLLASLVVLFFMGSVRSTLIAAVAIPTSVIASFTLMYFAGFTINRITLLALTLSVGIVIDDAIVVLENIYRHIEEKGLSPLEAARTGAAEVGLAVSATTLSLVIVFVPLALLPGITGRFLYSFGITIACAIMVSLLVAFTLTPVLCSRWLRPVGPGGSRHSSRESRLFAPIDRAYTALLRWSMRHRWLVVATALFLVLCVPALMRQTGAAFMPEDDRGEFEVNVKFPQGVSLAEVDRMLAQMETAMRPIPGILGLLTTVGGQGDAITTGQIFVQLAAGEDRSVHQFTVMDDVRRRLAGFRRQLRISVDNPPPVTGSGFRPAQINYNVRGPELSVVERYAQAVWRIMEQMPDVVDLDTTAEPGKPELQVHIDRAKASDLGVGVADIAQALRLMITGQVVTQYKEGLDLYDVRLRLRELDRQTAAALSQVTVPSSTLGQVRLDNLVSLRPGTGPAQIERQDRQRQVTLLGNVATGRALGDVLADIDKGVAALDLPPAYTTDVSGRGKLFAETVLGFQVAITLSVIFMYMVLAAQFESFIHPLTIMLSLPLAVPFALLSLWATGNTLNLFSGLGVLLLFGIVKKNSILQVDHTLVLRRAGMARAEAIITANRERLRPILMTTISLVAGMTPAALASGPGAETANAIAIVVIGGQTLCLLITLLMTPVAYSLFEDIGPAVRAGMTALRNGVRAHAGLRWFKPSRERQSAGGEAVHSARASSTSKAG
jgi:HAE1 family hydrophobic/amphiphilic exporter-1